MSAVIVAGDVSGSVSLTAPSVAGSTVITLPSTSGTMAKLTDIPAAQWTTTGSDIYYSTGKVAVGTSSIVSGGASLQTANGLTFPATQVASSNANTLDDYEEGTWTPTKGAGITGTVASSTGNYVKVGNTVYINGTFTGSGSISMSTRGIAVAGGLPFAGYGQGTGVVCNNAGEGGACIINFSGALFYTDSAAITGSAYFYFAGSYITS